MTRRVFCAAAAALVALTTTQFVSGDEFPLNGKNTTIQFVGTKPGGKHDGGFKELTGTAKIEGKDAATLKLDVEIDASSMYSDNAKLTQHLKSPDFFGVKENPKAKFVSTKIEKSGDGYKVTGDLTLCGQTKSLSFPAQIKADGGSLTLTSKFTIDRTQWGMTYGQGKVDNNVTLTVNVNAKK
jgi:polyisoprenoid-binding protein YceI